MTTTLPDKWHSTNLLFNKLEANEIIKVQQLFSDSQYMNQWDGHTYDPQYIERCYYSGDLPLEGKKENFCIYTIKSTEINELLGFISLYHGYPTYDSAYISFMYIDKNKQGNGYGQEAEAQLSKELFKLGFKYIRANIAIKNWPAIRFWTKAGFTEISGVFGDKIHSETTYADIELIKTI